MFTCYSDFQTIRKNFPAEILSKKAWVCFRVIDRDGKKAKPPFSAVTGKMIGPNAMNTDLLVTFEQAVSFCIRNGCDGVGIMLMDDGLCAIDLDACVSVDGKLNDYAQRIVDRFGCYTELSISGTGVHILCSCEEGLSINCNLRNLPNQNLLEMASCKKYLTVSGRCIVPFPVKPIDSTADFLLLYEHQSKKNGHQKKNNKKKVFSSPVFSRMGTNDESVLDMIRASNDRKTQNLFDGLVDLNDSQADFRLCMGLIYWCHQDLQQVDRLFRQSALMRPKWDRPYSDGTTYGSRTIEKAYENFQMFNKEKYHRKGGEQK